MSDPVLQGFLKGQLPAGLDLAAQSDLLELYPQSIDRYVAVFRCKGLIRTDAGEIVEASEFHVGIWFPSDPSYCRHADPYTVLSFLHPHNVFHPNIRAPFICAKILPATELVDLLYTLYEFITYSTWASHDGLNQDACQWARNHQDRFPIDRRPLKRRMLDLHVKEETNQS